MGQTQKPEVTKAEIEGAQTLWNNFTELLKWSVIAIIIVLALMAAFLV